jgi:hypothetical protein
LEISDKAIFSADFLIKLEMIDRSLFVVGEHFFVIMLVFIKNPLEIWHCLSKLHLFPSFPLSHNLANKILVVVALDHCESQFIHFDAFVNLELFE